MTTEMTREDIRNAISEIDLKLIDAIAQRSDLVEEILKAKARSGSPVRDRERERDRKSVV